MEIKETFDFCPASQSLIPLPVGEDARGTCFYLKRKRDENMRNGNVGVCNIDVSIWDLIMYVVFFYLFISLFYIRIILEHIFNVTDGIMRFKNIRASFNIKPSTSS